MPGIIEQQLPQNLEGLGNDDPDEAAQSSVAGYEPAQIEVNEQQDTVAGRINSIVAQNSPLMQSARTRAGQQSNARGILNSTMGVQAGEQAVLDTALPIAQQDAATSYQARSTNAAAQNQAYDRTTQGAQALQLSGQQGEIQSRLQQERGAIDLQLVEAEGDIRAQLLDRQAVIDQELAALQGDISSRLQSEQGTIQSGLQQERGVIDEGLARLQGNIQSTLQSEQGTIQSQLQAERGEIDLQLQSADAATRASLLERQGQIDTELAQVRGEIERDLLAQRGDIDLRLQSADAATRSALLQQQGALDMQLAEQRGDIDGRLQAERGVIELQLQEADAATRERLLERQGEIDQGLLEIQQQGQQELADIQGQWSSLLQTSQSATVFYSEIATQIGNVLANDRIRTDEKQQLVNQLRGQLSEGLELIGAIGDIDFSELLSFNSNNNPNATFDENAQDYNGVIDSVLRSARLTGGVF